MISKHAILKHFMKYFFLVLLCASADTTPDIKADPIEKNISLNPAQGSFSNIDSVDHVQGRVLIKFSSKIQQVDPQRTFFWTKSPSVNSALVTQGINELKEVFPNKSISKVVTAMAEGSEERLKLSELSRWYLGVVPAGVDIKAAVENLKSQAGVEAAEPDYIRRISGRPAEVELKDSRIGNLGALKNKNPKKGRFLPMAAQVPNASSDPLFAQQWHLTAAGVPEAWNYLQSLGLSPGGSRDVIVAVIDTGVDYLHPDLAANIWTNSREIAGNGIDDDGNGYVDDVHGADVIANTGNPMDYHGHGTHVAGIIAAQGNNGIGGVGVAYNVQIMPITAAQYSGVLATSDVAKALYYAADKGADIINMSFGGYGKSQVEEDALAVAFTSAVLVASAGNDGKPNESLCTDGKAMYPAAYNWVLGIMASDSSNFPAFFSNWDCIPQNLIEYELKAPGVEIWSTLPNAQYAAWSGTSMAAPIVSGIAALIRTKYPDKNNYTSRFIMGQLATNSSPIANAQTALTVVPKPEVTYLDHVIFDKKTTSVINDEDGFVDSGETIDLGVILKNRWGKAENVSATLSPWAEGAIGPDPYVSMLIDTVDYGAIGSFNQDDNGIVYESGVPKSVAFPFRFSVDSSTPNNHSIPFRLTVTCKNGMDLSDASTYTFTSYFKVNVRRGVEVYGEIAVNTTWASDKEYIVTNSINIPDGLTLTIEEGTRVLFNEGTALFVHGNLVANGTKENNIVLCGNGLNPSREYWLGIRVYPATNLDLSFLEVAHAADFIDRNYASNSESGKILSIKNCYVHDCVSHISQGGGAAEIHIEGNIFCRGWWFIENISLNSGDRIINNIFSDLDYPGYPRADTAAMSIMRADSSNIIIENNSFINNNPWNVGIDSSAGIDASVQFKDNYWGAFSEQEIRKKIFDYYSDYSRPKILVTPFLALPSPDAPAQISSIALSDGGPIGVGEVEFTISFNCNMDTETEAVVTFGSAAPYTDHAIRGIWVDSKTWRGSYTVTPMTGDGIHTIIVSKARGTFDWREVTKEYRHKFEIITSGTSAMNLQATGGEGFVDLSWTQNDFDLLAGYNLYRSTSLDGSFTRINANLIPSSTKTYRDSNIQPGQTYFYKFTVVKTDMTESGASNIASATPLDTIPPVLTHTPLTTAEPGLSLTINADATDNVAVKSVSLYHRKTGTTPYTMVPMTNTGNSRYSATLEGSLVASPGIDYYIEAKDNVNTVMAGRPENPYPVTIEDRPVVTAVSPNKGPISGETSVTIAGSNFNANPTVTFGGAIASNVTLVSSSQITCMTPSHFPEIVDVTVTNTEGQSGTLLRGFTYESDIASISLPNTRGGKGQLVTVPVNAANIQGLAAADLTITFDGAVLAANKAATGSLTPGWTITYNVNTPGIIYISLVSPTGTQSGSGVLANIEFDVIGDFGATSPLHFQAVKLNDGAIPSQASDGVFTVDQAYSVTGMVRYWKDNTGVPGVLLSLEGDRKYEGTSGANGAFSVSNAPVGNYTLKPEKSDGISGISAYDASLILQHATKLITLTGNAAITADINKSGDITSMDAYYVLQKAVDLIALPFPGAGIVWQFDPASRSYSPLNANQTDQDFAGILLGDVSGNWAQGSQPAAQQARAAIQSRALIEPISDDGKVNVSFWVDPNPGSIFSLDAVMNYDAAKATPLSAALAPLTNTWMLEKNFNQAGSVRLASAGAISVSQPAMLLGLQFQPTVTDQPLGLTIAKFALDETPVTAVLMPVILGKIIDKDGMGMAGLTIAFSGEGGSVITDENGNYSQAVPYGWTGIATPTKTGATFDPPNRSYTTLMTGQGKQDYAATAACPRLGDVNEDQTISPGDAQKAFDIYLQRLTPTICQNKTADANCNGGITPSDAQWIFEHYLGRRTLPMECSGTSSQGTEPNLTGRIVVGPSKEESPVLVIVPMMVRGAAGMKAFGLDVAYQLGGYEFAGIRAGEMTRGFITLDAQEIGLGKVRVGGYDLDGIAGTGDGVLFELVFRKRASQASPISIIVSNLIDGLRGFAGK